jgi:hypothetical protein
MDSSIINLQLPFFLMASLGCREFIRAILSSVERGWATPLPCGEGLGERSQTMNYFKFYFKLFFIQ